MEFAVHKLTPSGCIGVSCCVRLLLPGLTGVQRVQQSRVLLEPPKRTAMRVEAQLEQYTGSQSIGRRVNYRDLISHSHIYNTLAVERGT